MVRRAITAATVSTTCRVLLLVLSLTSATHGYVRFCYFTNWAQWRTGATFSPADIDPQLCTHIIFAFGRLVNNTLEPIEDNDILLYQQVNALKEINPNLKVVLAIGGWTADNTQFTNLVSTTAGMNDFANTTIAFLRQHKLDGLDIDWEYPAGRGGPYVDRARFTVWLQNLRDAFDEEARVTGSPPLLLVAALVGPIGAAHGYYEIQQVTGLLDYVNIMSYDYSGTWLTRTDLHCDLFPHVSDSMQGYLNAGVPRNKLVMGVAFYGISFTLAATNPEPANYGLDQPFAGRGAPAKYTKAAGQMAYFEICELVKSGNWTEVYSTARASPMAYGPVGDKMIWAGYDNILSLREKAKYIRDNRLAGAMIWSLDQDDYNNTCGGGPFPLANALLEQLPWDGEVVATTTTPTPATTTTSTTTSTTTKSTSPPATESLTTASESTAIASESTTTVTESATTASESATTASTTEGKSDDSTPTDPEWVTTTTTEEPTAAPATTTQKPTTQQPRKPKIQPPKIPFSIPAGRRGRCALRISSEDPMTLVRGSMKNFVAYRWGRISLICQCQGRLVYNPCRKRCDFKTNRATCGRYV